MQTPCHDARNDEEKEARQQLISGILTPVPNCCSAWTLSNLINAERVKGYQKTGHYKGFVAIPEDVKIGFPDQYKDSTIIAIDNSDRNAKDLEESGFVPVCKFLSRYNTNHPLTLWVRAKGNDLEIIQPKKGKTSKKAA